MIKELNTIVKPVTTFHQDESFDDITSLKAWAKTQPFLESVKVRTAPRYTTPTGNGLSVFFVQEMGYKANIDEGDILAAEKLDAYINGQTDSIERICGLRPVITNKKELDWL